MFDNYEALIAAITKAKKTPILLSLEKISKLNHFQVRNVASNTVHIDTIAERINDKLCTTEGMEPIIILQNYKIIELSKTKYRVLIGPFNDIKKLEKIFNEIKSLNFENIEILKSKNPSTNNRIR